LDKLLKQRHVAYNALVAAEEMAKEKLPQLEKAADEADSNMVQANLDWGSRGGG